MRYSSNVHVCVLLLAWLIAFSSMSAHQSYGGKYVPSIAHYILQVEAQWQAQDQGAEGKEAGSVQGPARSVQLTKTRALPPNVPRPLFSLKGGSG